MFFEKSYFQYCNYRKKKNRTLRISSNIKRRLLKVLMRFSNNVTEMNHWKTQQIYRMNYNDVMGGVTLYIIGRNAWARVTIFYVRTLHTIRPVTRSHSHNMCHHYHNTLHDLLIVNNENNGLTVIAHTTLLYM